MKTYFAPEQVIENLVAAILGEHASAREKHMLRESLHGLVRLAKAEQVAEIRENVEHLADTLAAQTARRRTKAILMAQRLPSLLEQAEQQSGYRH